MPVVGTAGHVDHGKSTLIEAITGRDPDRWAIEKERGLTIDLGFAWATLPSGREVSFVDVPGHERYLKNMLAGIEAVDAALLVVAANEGWMPQTEEHLAVLDLLGVEHGVVAISKTDLVDEETLEMAILETAERTEGTSLESAPIVAVSALDEQSLDPLIEEIDRALPEKPPEGSRPRLWIDRAFAVPGAGSVVTGTLVDGTLRVGDAMVVLPDGVSASIKGLQSHERQVQVAVAGTRVAVNLRGIEIGQIGRGSMLGSPDQWELTDRFSATLRIARYAEPITTRGAYQLHIGSGAHALSILAVDGRHMVAKIRDPLPLARGDRFIVRDTGRRQVVGGGRVLDPDPGTAISSLEAATALAHARDPDEVADVLLAIRGIETVDRLSAHSGGGRSSSGITAGQLVMSKSTAEDLRMKTVKLVQAEHESHPLREGVTIASLAGKLGVHRETLVFALDEEAGLTVDGAIVRDPAHEPKPTAAQESAWQTARSQLDQGLDVPDPGRLGLEPDLIHFLVRSDELISINPELALLPSQVEKIAELVSQLDDGFTVSEFGKAAGVSRKYAVPYLEWADRQHLTVRRGDLRYRITSDD